MAVITSLIAVASVAAGVVGHMSQRKAAKEQAAAARKQAEETKKAAEQAAAQKPADKTGADVRLARRDKELKRGKGSLAKRRREAALAGQSLAAPNAATVGGLE